MSTASSFHGKTALVVGGSSGIGRAVALAFSAAGADVHIWGRRRPAAQDYDRNEGSFDGVQFASVDVTDDRAVEAESAEFERLDALVLSQGTLIHGQGEFDLDAFRAVVALNLTSVMTCAVKFRPLLQRAGGTIVIINSIAALHATFGQPAYSASKTGVLGLTRTLAKSWAADGIRVNAVAPGVVATRMVRSVLDDPVRAAGIVARVPIGRLTLAEEVAAAVLFLASPSASAIVGVTLPVDGGMHL
jgi:3-oxoacyl-[acyl-carrier protein] reductase